MSNTVQELTPQERMLKSEGEAMLAQIAKNQPKSTLLDANGDPIVSKTEPVPQMDPQEAMRRYQDRLERRMLASRRKLGEIFGKEGTKTKEGFQPGPLEQMCEVITTSHMLIFWANMELAMHPEMTDEIIADYSRYVQDAVYHDAQKYNLKQVFADLRYKVVPLMQDYIRKYEDEGKVRKVKIEKNKKILGADGINLLPGMKEKLKVPFVPGRLVVIRGSEEACNETFAALGNVYAQQTKMEPYYTTKEEIKNKASTVESLYEALAPTVDSEAMLLLVPSLYELYVDDNLDLTQEERKAFALKRLYGWAVDNMIAVVVADIAKEDEKQQDYGFVTHFDVSTSDGKLIIS